MVKTFLSSVPVTFTSHNGSITVTGGNVVLFVDGDLTLGAGGNEGLVIAPGSTLTVTVTGKTNFKSSLQTASLPLVTNDRPTFALYSTREDSNPGQSGANPGNSGVVVDGNSKALANIYAPGSNESIVGSGGIKGTVRGKNIDVRGGRHHHQRGRIYGSKWCSWAYLLAISRLPARSRPILPSSLRIHRLDCRYVPLWRSTV